MAKSIALLVINGNQLVDDLLDDNIKYLIDQVGLLNYRISKVSVIRSDRDLIIFELINLLKQNHFALLFDKCQTLPISTYLCNVFNFGDYDDNVNYLQYSKLLTYDNRIKLKPVIYLSRLFIIQELNLKQVFDHILKGHLIQFNRENVFSKMLKLKSLRLLDTLDKTDCDITVFEQNSTHTIQLKSSRFTKLIDCQRYLQNEIIDHCYLDVPNLEDIFCNCWCHIHQAIESIEKCLSDYGLDNVFISFNGGKDCTVLLHLVLGVLKRQYPEYKGPVVCMYVQSLNPFPEVNDFIEMVRDYYNLDVVTITKGVRDGLKLFLEGRPNMKACLMGTRRSDPYSESLQVFQMTDPDWPQVMRVSPLLDWHYSEIWDFLLYYQIPYCNLYDDGYTSLGSIHNTIKNPHLSYKMYKDVEEYLPAYKLLDGTSERSGRL